MHGLLDFPCDTVFAAPTVLGFAVILSTFTNSDVKIHRRQHAFSVRIVPYRNKLPEDIVNVSWVATVYTMAVPIP